MSLLWLQSVNHNEVLFVTDADSHMVKAAKHLKMSHPRIIYITCNANKSSMNNCIHFYHHQIISKRIPFVIM